MRKSLIAGAFAVMAVSTTANAAIEYEFTAFSTFPAGAYTSVSGSFTYIAPDFITSDTRIDPADLASCSASDSLLLALSLAHLKVFCLMSLPPDHDSFWRNRTARHRVLLDPTAFSTIGVHDTVFFGTDQAAQLVASEASSVPEMSTWAMLVAGFCTLGAIVSLRGRARRALDAA